MYLKPKISPESTKYVEAEHEKEEGDNRKAENINQPLIGLYIFRSSCICQVFLLMKHLISIGEKKQDLPKIEVGHYGWQRTPVTREINVHQTLKNCEGIISESIRSVLIFITGQWCWFVKRKKLMNVLFFFFVPIVVGVRREK